MKMKIKRLIVTAVDYASKTPEVRAVCKTEAEAKNFAIEDMREYADMHANEGMVFDDECLRVADDDWKAGCEWNIEDVEFELTDDEVIEIGAHRYVEGIQHGIDMAKEEN